MYSRDYPCGPHQPAVHDDSCPRMTHRDDLTLAQRIDPVLVPQKIQQLGIQARLEDGDLELIVRVGVDTEILDLVERDGLVVVGGSVGWSVAL